MTDNVCEGRLDMTFEGLCQQLIQSQFASDAFQGGPDSYQLPVQVGHKCLGYMAARAWSQVLGGLGQRGPHLSSQRSPQQITTQEQERLQRQTPDHTELEAPIDEFMRCQFDDRDTTRAKELVPVFGHRLVQAAQMRGAHAQMVHAISRNFTMKDTNPN